MIKLPKNGLQGRSRFRPRRSIIPTVSIPNCATCGKPHVGLGVTTALGNCPKCGKPILPAVISPRSRNNK